MLFFVPLCFPSVSALDKYGLKTGVAIGIIITTAGCFIKCFIDSSFNWVMLG
jgi:fucose permease